MLRRAGQMTLTLYVLHVFVFNVFVDMAGVGAADRARHCPGSPVGFWVIAIALGAWWHRFLGQGPLERIYRRFGG